MKYKTWIKKNTKGTRGQCQKRTQEMQEAFPELKIVRGHYYCPFEGKREHWWLKDIKEGIIDPTASQFLSNGQGEYVEWTEGAPEPTGRCIHCGEYCFNGNHFCSQDCRVANQKILTNEKETLEKRKKTFEKILKRSIERDKDIITELGKR